MLINFNHLIVQSGDQFQHDTLTITGHGEDALGLEQIEAVVINDIFSGDAIHHDPRLWKCLVAQTGVAVLYLFHPGLKGLFLARLAKDSALSSSASSATTEAAFVEGVRSGFGISRDGFMEAAYRNYLRKRDKE